MNHPVVPVSAIMVLERNGIFPEAGVSQIRGKNPPMEEIPGMDRLQQ